MMAFRFLRCKKRNTAKKIKKTKRGERGEKRNKFLKIFSFVFPTTTPLIEKQIKSLFSWFQFQYPVNRGILSPENTGRQLQISLHAVCSIIIGGQQPCRMDQCGWRILLQLRYSRLHRQYHCPRRVHCQHLQLRQFRQHHQLYRKHCQ